MIKVAAILMLLAVPRPPLYWVTATGVLADVLARQASSISLLPTHYFGSAVLNEYIEALVNFAPDDIGYAWTVSSGSEAVENSIKLAVQYHSIVGNKGRHKIIGRWHSYHGGTITALDVGGITQRRALYSSLMRQHPHVSPAYCYRCPFSLEPDHCARECARELGLTILREEPDTVAGFIMEPVVGAALGAVPAPADYVQIVRRICDKYGILLIFDEVMTGFGRTGRNFAADHWQVSPDIIAVGKGMSGGYYPLGGVLVSRKVGGLLEERNIPFAGGHTYACNPLGAAVGLQVLREIETRGLVEHSAELGKHALLRMQEFRRSPIVGDVRGLGLLLGIEFVKDQKTKEPWPPFSSIRIESKNREDRQL